MIREQTKDGLELVEFALKVWRGELRDADDKPIMDSEKSRTWAHEWLSDRSLGKALESVDMLFGSVDVTPESQAMMDALRLSPHERRARIDELRERAKLAAPDLDAHDPG